MHEGALLLKYLAQQLHHQAPIALRSQITAAQQQVDAVRKVVTERAGVLTSRQALMRE